jgi:hypothetical protein
MVYCKPNSFTNVADSLNKTRIQPPTVAWLVQTHTQIIKTQLSRMPALQTAYLAARRNSTLNQQHMTINDGDTYTTAFPIDVATNRQPQTDRRYIRHTDSKATHTMPPQIRGGNEKQILEPVTKTGNQLKMQPIDMTSVNIHHRE